MQYYLNKIPKELINIIVSYTGIVKKRNGKYMIQMDKNDVRYEIIKNIPRNIEVVSTKWIMARITKFFSIIIFPREEYEKNEVDYVYDFCTMCNDENCVNDDLCHLCESNYNTYGALNRLYYYKLK